MSDSTLQSAVKPPRTPEKPFSRVHLGVTLSDEFAWLRDKESPEVIAALEAENEYTKSVMADTADVQEKLYQEMLGRIKETDISVPQRKGHYWYYNRTEQGKAYAIHCRRHIQEGSEEQIILDENELAAGKDFFSLGALAVSPDESLLAWAEDFNGSEEYTIRVKNLITGEWLPDQVVKVSGDMEWARDNRTLFYVTLDHAHRPYKLFAHRLGDAAPDREVFHEPDDSYFLGIGKTKDHRWLVISLQSKITSEWHYLDAAEPDGNFRVVRPRSRGVEYSLTHHEDWFYIVTNLDAVNFRLMKAPVTAPADWVEVIGHDAGVKMDGAEAFKDHLIIEGRRNGLTALMVMNLRNGERHDVDFPEPVYTVWAENNPEFETDILRFTYTSLVTPVSVFDYNLSTRERELRKETEVIGGYDRNQYTSERIFATAEDGVKVPVSLFYRKGTPLDGSAALLLYAYGSYGHSTDPYFNSNRISLVDRGVIFALAHIRGGGEMGRLWYEEGKFLKKKNTFEDYIACANHLIAARYTSASRLAGFGGSAGGLLMGAAANLRPDLFHALVAHVPFVDVVNTMLDPDLPLTVIEYEEWGNPNEQQYFDYMLSYSPYDNLKAQSYPHLLVTAGLNDPRVGYWEPAKWVSRLRKLAQGDKLILLKTNMGAGHQGQSGRYGHLKEVAFDYAFLFKVWGITVQM